jgi:RNA polymerase sigma-70 factor (ECF subfamily)
MEPSEGSQPLFQTETLVRAAQAGDTAATSALMDLLIPYLGRICGAIALEDGDDALQETMIAVLRNIRSLREPRALYGWARRIAIRQAVRVGRRRLREEPVEMAERAAPAIDYDAVLDVASVLRELPPHLRAILVLRDLEGLTEEEAATQLAVPVGTVKSRLHRARTLFQRRYQP